MPVTTLAAPSPKVIPWMTRARVPLIAVTVALVALDAIGLGLRWADASNNAVSEVTPRVLRPHVTSPDAVVAGSDDLTGRSSGTAGTDANSASRSGSTGSGAFVGPIAPPIARPTPATPTQPSGSRPTPTPAPAVPLAQIDLAVPGVARVSVGAGDNSCTTVDLTLIALGDCPVPSGEGPVILHVGGSLLGG